MISKGKLSFGLDNDDDEQQISSESGKVSPPRNLANAEESSSKSLASETLAPGVKTRLGPNNGLNVPPPRAVTKSALRSDALTRENLRRSFLSLQETVRATTVAIPFVFYDGTNTPGGICRMKKGEHIWLLLDRARKVGAKLGVSGGGRGGGVMAGSEGGSGSKSSGSAAKIASNKTRSHWARIGVDDLLLVRGEVIIPHHYEIYYFLANKTLGPNGRPLFNYSDGTNEPPENSSSHSNAQGSPKAPLEAACDSDKVASAEPDHEYDPLSRAGRARHSPSVIGSDDEYKHLEGYTDDPNLTKVVDRRWYERNKHIFPASMWEEFDPGKAYKGRVRKDRQGNSYFFS